MSDAVTTTPIPEQARTERRAAPPGPRGVPLLGSVLDLWRDPLGTFLDARREHGDVALLRFGPVQCLCVNDPEALKHVLVDNAKNYRKGRQYEAMRLLLGQGLVTSEGDFWRKQRRLVQPAFHREKLEGFAQVMTEETRAMLARWPAHGVPFDLHREFNRLTFLIVGRTLFSTNVEQEASQVGDALAYLVRFLNDYSLQLVPPPQWLPTPNMLRFHREKRTLDALVQRIIEERRRSDEKKNDLLGMLLHARDADTGEGMSDLQLRDEVMTLVTAGHETTANGLTWVFYYLSKQPSVAARVREELRSVLGDRTATAADMPALAYTTRVVQEAMRLRPPVWSFERQALEEDTILGYRVPAGMSIGIFPYVLHRHPELWPNPEGFDPDRFTPEASAARSRYAYLPFGGGPRVCIGNSFAMMEMVLCAATVLQQRRVDLVAGERVEPEAAVTLRPRYGMRVVTRSAAMLDAPRA